MSFSIIAAMTQKTRVIGYENKLPWHLPEDLKHFKKLTSNKVILMGRKTYESIGKPLPNRFNIVISSKNVGCLSQTSNNLLLFSSVKEAVECAEKIALEKECYSSEVMIIGGQKIYEQTLPLCNKLYITEVKKEYFGDTTFPEFNEEYWDRKLVSETQDCKFIEYYRSIVKE